MRVVTTRRPKTIFVKKGSVDQAGSFLDTLPEKPKEEFSLRAAAHYLREPIRAALAKGYTYEEVAALLAEHGIAISASTLKNYVPSGKRQSTKEGAADGGRKTRKAEGKSTMGKASDESVTSTRAKAAKQDDNVLPFVAPKAAKQEESTPEPSTKRRTRATAAKNQTEASTTAKATAKSKSTSRKTIPAKLTKKPATRGRKKTD